MDDWIGIAEAAQVLGVSARHVRNLAEHGHLPARRVGRAWLIDSKAARSRGARPPNPGRPLSASMAWTMLGLVQQWIDTSLGAPGDRELLESIPDRQMRYRLRRMFAQPIPASKWQTWLHPRAERRRLWAHPGVLKGMASDGDLHAGGAFAAAARGIGIAAFVPNRFYVHSEVVDRVISRYHATVDAAGSVELLVVRGNVAEDLLAGRGAVPVAVALADMLESDDARERHIAAERFARFVLVSAS